MELVRSVCDTLSDRAAAVMGSRPDERDVYRGQMLKEMAERYAVNGQERALRRQREAGEAEARLLRSRRKTSRYMCVWWKKELSKWEARVRRKELKEFRRVFDSDVEAARAVDEYLVENGHEPVNFDESGAPLRDDLRKIKESVASDPDAGLRPEAEERVVDEGPAMPHRLRAALDANLSMIDWDYAACDEREDRARRDAALDILSRRTEVSSKYLGVIRKGGKWRAYPYIPELKDQISCGAYDNEDEAGGVVNAKLAQYGRPPVNFDEDGEALPPPTLFSATDAERVEREVKADRKSVV